MSEGKDIRVAILKDRVKNLSRAQQVYLLGKLLCLVSASQADNLLAEADRFILPSSGFGNTTPWRR